MVQENILKFISETENNEVFIQLNKRINIKYKKCQKFDGTVENIIYQIGDGSIIKLFDKTPFPRKTTDVVCPHFVELKWANGCPFNCSWCYLQGTFRFLNRKKNPFVKDVEKAKIHVWKFLNEVNHKKYVLNSGELADSLLSENHEKPFSKWIIPMFETQKNHKVLFLTKSTNIKNILEIEKHNQTIVSYSLNSEKVAKKWEKAPSPKERIKALKRLYEAGYEIRVRIDPMVPNENWQKEYKILIDMLFSNLEPERITLGSLRGLQSTINESEDKSWVKYLSECSNWGKKIDFNKRFEMYSTLIEYLEEIWSRKYKMYIQ
ncbi:MAG: radical SAM protein [Candidatus Methanofastidiosia archaeon]